MLVHHTANYTLRTIDHSGLSVKCDVFDLTKKLLDFTYKKTQTDQHMFVTLSPCLIVTNIPDGLEDDLENEFETDDGDDRMTETGLAGPSVFYDRMADLWLTATFDPEHYPDGILYEDGPEATYENWLREFSESVVFHTLHCEGGADNVDMSEANCQRVEERTKELVDEFYGHPV